MYYRLFKYLQMMGKKYDGIDIFNKFGAFNFEAITGKKIFQFSYQLTLQAAKDIKAKKIDTMEVFFWS